MVKKQLSEYSIEELQAELDKRNKKLVLGCPLCPRDLYMSEGSTGNSGEYDPPYVACECGFRFKTDTKNITCRVGQSGWDAIFEHKRNTINMLVNRFGRRK